VRLERNCLDYGSQNYPYVPMYDAWIKKSKTIDEKWQADSAKKSLIKICPCNYKKIPCIFTERWCL